MVEIIRADLHNPRHGEALIAMLDEYARDEMGGGNALADEVKANLADALAARPGAHVLLALTSLLMWNKLHGPAGRGITLLLLGALVTVLVALL